MAHGPDAGLKNLIYSIHFPLFLNMKIAKICIMGTHIFKKVLALTVWPAGIEFIDQVAHL
jgi:hypothetical protein